MTSRIPTDMVADRTSKAKLSDTLGSMQTSINTNTSSLADIMLDLKQLSGAKGDGVTDDTTVLQTVINNYSSNCTFNLPSGTYLISSPLLFQNKTNIRLTGKGIIKLKNQSSSQKILAFLDSTGIEVDGIEINGNRSNQTKVTTGASWNVSENCPGILLENVKKANIHHTYIHDVIGDGIELDVLWNGQSNTSGRQCEDVDIYNNIIDTIGRNGVSLVHCDNVNIFDNRIRNVDKYTTTLAAGVDVEPSPGYNYLTQNIKIHDNDIESCKTCGVQVFNPNNLSTVSNIEVSDNRFLNCTTGHLTISCKTQGQHIIYKDNKTKDCNNGFSFDDCQYVTFKDEIVKNCLKLDSTNGFGISCDINLTSVTSSFITLTGLIVDGTDDVGIYLKNIKDSEIDAYVRNDSRVITSDKASIRFLNACSNIKVMKCVTKTNGTYPVYITDMGSTMGTIEVYNNSFFNNQDIAVVSTTVTLKRNNNVFTSGVFDGITTTNFVVSSGGTISKGKFQGQSLYLPSIDSALLQGQIAWDSGYTKVRVQDGYIEKYVAFFLKGTLANRPTGTKRIGDMYFATDYKTNGGWLTWNGSSWIDDSANPSTIVS